MSEQHTHGPWRWEFNREHKSLHLVGGRPQYDLSIMDFDRWGMGGAVATLRDPSADGMNIMHRLCDRPDWIAPFPGRAHHANWCADVTHPDMRLIAAAPELLAALKVARGRIAEDRQSLHDCHAGPNGDVDDEGADGLADYDATLAVIDAAIAKASAEVTK